jgi:hypothetical protein
MRLADMAPLAAVEGARFYSLQRGTRRKELAAPPAGLEVIDIAALREGFLLWPVARWAAVLENLDLVLTADSPIADMAGALGKPVWVMLPVAPPFRWFLDRADSPWYPTARLFRQREPGEWAPVVAGVADALRELVAARAGASGRGSATAVAAAPPAR